MNIVWARLSNLALCWRTSNINCEIFNRLISSIRSAGVGTQGGEDCQKLHPIKVYSKLQQENPGKIAI